MCSQSAKKKRHPSTNAALVLLIGMLVISAAAEIPAQTALPPDAAVPGGQAGSGANSSSYRLIGTVEFGDVAGAVLDDSTGAQTFYRLGEKLPDGSQIIRIRGDSITLKGSDGAVHDLYTIHDNAPRRPPNQRGPR